MKFLNLATRLRLDLRFFRLRIINLFLLNRIIIKAWLDIMRFVVITLNINARKACGHDTITPRLLKESASVISGPLAELMNESIKQCKYPSRWRMGQVTPLFKKNNEFE